MKNQNMSISELAKKSGQTEYPFASKKGDAKTRTVVIVLGLDSTPETVVYLSSVKGSVAIQSNKVAAFEKEYIGLSYGGDFSARRWALEMLTAPKAKFSTAALQHLERILAMETQGMTTADIGDLVFEQFGATMKVAPQYPDRAAAVVAYAQAREAATSTTTTTTTTTTKGNPMATKKVTAAKPAAAKPNPADNAETFLSDKAKARLAKEAADRKSKAEAKPAAKEAKPAKAKVDKSASYTLAGEALKVKSPEELRMHEASARSTLMAHLLKTNAKTKSGYTIAGLEAAGFKNAPSAVPQFVKQGFLVRVGA